MTFDEWWGVDWPTVSIVENERELASRVWQAAQKEAAKRCAEIATLRFIGDRQWETAGPVIAATIEREFGLDK